MINDNNDNSSNNDDANDEFIHIFILGRGKYEHVLLLLHGTGGYEQDMIPLAREILPEVLLLSIRGKVKEKWDVEIL